MEVQDATSVFKFCFMPHLLILHSQGARTSRRERHASNNESRPCVSYFDRLPLELKVEIFDSLMRSTSYPVLSTEEAPLLLCRVSSSWRAIVRCTPRLWARFGVNIPEFGVIDSTHDQNRMKALELWLKRSRNNALSIRINHTPVGHISDYRSAKLLAALAPHAHRWQDVDFHIPSSSVELLQDLSLGALPALRSVTLDMKGLWRPRVPFDLQAIGIPWGQLTGLSLHFDVDHLLTLNQCLDILSRCANLSRCTMNADCTLGTQVGTQDRLARKLTLPVLNHFDLILQREEQAFRERHATRRHGGVMSNLLPRATRFSSVAVTGSAMASQVGCRWKTLAESTITVQCDTCHRGTSPTIVVSRLPTPHGRRCGCVPRAGCIAFPGWTCVSPWQTGNTIRSTDAFFSACTLHCDGSSPDILPLLESVHLQCHGARHTTVAVADLIRSRRMPVQGNAHLQSFSLVSLKPVSAHTRQMLKNWSDKGWMSQWIKFLCDDHEWVDALNNGCFSSPGATYR
ncbi:hypothetical protein FPV67DRAFT_1444760 [Lyophyllum atratum]|nr:hypothetical protein FPV67DRAFT_1444760 [Lyophyllum atratum]